MADIIDIASREIGYRESGDNINKFGAYFGNNGAPWCHYFASWCAVQAGAASITPQTGGCSVGVGWFSARARFRLRGTYVPKRNDFIYFGAGGGRHVGIVAYAQNGIVHTIEGNSGDSAKERAYPLSHLDIYGYGLVADYMPGASNSSSDGYPSSTGTGSGGSTSGGTNIGSSTGSGGNTDNTGGLSIATQKKTSAYELEYLKRILEKKKPIPTVIKGSATLIKTHPNVMVNLIIENGKKRFTVPVLNDMILALERQGTPGKLSFKTRITSKFPIMEGNTTRLYVDGKEMFYGFVFTRKKTRDGTTEVTAYDQLRYLKNKDTIVYKKKTASEVVKLIAKRFQLNYGKLPEMTYRMSKVEDDATLFDIIQNALDETLMAKGDLYVLYDAAGKLMLNNIANMRVDSCLIDEDTAENYQYGTTIDSDVYNQVKLVYENADTGKYDLYVEKSTKSINSWGLLQYTEKIQDPDVGKLKSQALLKMYNKKKRTLTIDGAFGNKNVIAGCMIPVILNLGDVKVKNYMTVEKVTHKFKNREHKMDLILSGGGFSV